MGTSLLIMLVGLLVPVLAAAPFYIQERRAEQRALEEQNREGARAEGERASTEDVPVPEMRRSS